MKEKGKCPGKAGPFEGRLFVKGRPGILHHQRHTIVMAEDTFTEGNLSKQGETTKRNRGLKSFIGKSPG